MKAKEIIPSSKPRNFVAKNMKGGNAGAHKDKKKAEKQGDTKHKKDFATMEDYAKFGSIYAEQLAQKVFDENPNLSTKGRADELLDAAFPIAVQDLGKKRAQWEFNYDEDFSSDFVSAYAWLQEGGDQQESDVEEAGYGNRDAYQRDYDSSISGMGTDRDFRNRERNAGLEDETNNIAININGKTWKVVPGRGYADSQEERSYLQGMQKWAEKKSAATGKKWSVHLTGAPVSK